MPVGNDVVDLSDSDADPRTLHPRFDRRVFARSELQLLASAGAGAAVLRWHLWAGKEAAFKVARKLDPAAIFSPVRFVVDLAPALSERTGRGGVVRWGLRRFDLALRQTGRAVHAVAHSRERPGARTLAAVERLAERERNDPESLSAAVRRLATEQLASCLGAAREELEVRLERRVPQLWMRGHRVPFDLSFSHHGCVVAFAAEATGALR